MRSILGEYAPNAVRGDDAQARLAAARYDIVRLKEAHIATNKAKRAAEVRFELAMAKFDKELADSACSIKENEDIIAAVLQMNSDLASNVKTLVELFPAEGLS